MKLYEALQQGGFHTAVMTTFGVDFDAFESIALARMRGAECRNVILIGDAGMLGLALDDSDRPPRFAGTGYLVSKAHAKGVFHPKIIVQIGKDKGRLIVSSANATAAGLAGNLEIVAVVECDARQSSERGLVLAAWQYSLRFLDGRQNAVEDKLRWARERSPWLDEPGGEGPALLSDGTQAAFLASGSVDGIAHRFVDLVDARRVDRLVVVSPYWDDDLGALDALRSALQPRHVHLLIDTERRLFPTLALSGKTGIEVSDIYGFDKKLFPAGNRRFIHAKMIVATVGGTDHVLMGSANCSFAALGNLRQQGTNEEACLYRRLPADRLLDELGLRSLLADAVDVAKLPAPVKQDDLPVAEASENDAGAFELAFDRLLWWPRSAALKEAMTENRAKLELLDSDARTLRFETSLLKVTGAHVEFRLSEVTSRPAFARILKTGGRRTALSIVACVAELRMQTRDPITAKAERAIKELAFDDDEGVWLLDVIHTLAVPKAIPTGHVPRSRDATGEKKNAATPMGPLGYEEFMRGRRRDFGKVEGERNSLAGQHVSYVRAALNRLLGMADAGQQNLTGDDDEKTAAAALDTGDEVGDGQDALDRGFDPNDPKQSARAAAELAKLRRQQDADAIASAVNNLTVHLRSSGELDTVDMLRLRAMLMIIGVSARPPGARQSPHLGQMQILPCSDDRHGHTWPRLMGRVLACIFGAPDPALKRLRFDRNHDRMPDDFLETWACCIWFSQAVAAAAKSDPGCATLVSHVVKLADSIKKMLPLSEDEKASPSFAGVLERLDQRFATRLALGPLTSASLAPIVSQTLAPVPTAGGKIRGRSTLG